MWSGSYGKPTFGAGTRLVVHPGEYDHANDQGKGTDDSSMRKQEKIYGQVGDI